MGKKVHLLEKILKNIMFYMGILGVAIIYGGFLYLLFSGRSTQQLPWYLLISPWICIYFGLTTTKQFAVYSWFMGKFKGKK